MSERRIGQSQKGKCLSLQERRMTLLEVVDGESGDVCYALAEWVGAPGHSSLTVAISDGTRTFHGSSLFFSLTTLGGGGVGGVALLALIVGDAVLFNCSPTPIVVC